MRANGGYKNFDFEILKTNITEEQGVNKERYYYDIYQPNLNNNGCRPKLQYFAQYSAIFQMEYSREN